MKVVCSMLSLILLVSPAAVGAGQGQGHDRSMQESILEQDLLAGQTAKAPERQTLHMESGETARTPLDDEGSRQEPADEMQKMNLLRPDWQRIVGKTGASTVYRRWLAKQPKAYQRMIESATTAAELNESIEEFLESSDALIAAHQEDLDVKLAEMRAKARGQIGTAMRSNGLSEDR